MRALLIVALVAVAACTSVVEVRMPYCPVSDSAWKKADSIPAICVLDTISRRHSHP